MFARRKLLVSETEACGIPVAAAAEGIRLAPETDGPCYGRPSIELVDVCEDAPQESALDGVMEGALDEMVGAVHEGEQRERSSQIERLDVGRPRPRPLEPVGVEGLSVALVRDLGLIERVGE